MEFGSSSGLSPIALTLDVAYVGNHGYREEASVDLNQPAIGAGWDATAVTACLNPATVPLYSKCKPDATAEVAASTTAQFPYINNIDFGDERGHFPTMTPCR